MAATQSPKIENGRWYSKGELRASTATANDGGLYENQLAHSDSETDAGPAEGRSYENHYLGDVQVATNSHMVWRPNSITPLAWMINGEDLIMCGRIEPHSEDGEAEIIVFSTTKDGKPIQGGRYVERKDIAPPELSQLT